MDATQENIQTPPPSDGFIQPPGFDKELDDVLSKAFPNAAPKEEVNPEPEVKNEPKPIEQPKPELLEKNGDKPKDVEAKKGDKTPEIEKPLTTPEEIDKLDSKSKGSWGVLKNAHKKANEIIAIRDQEISRLKASLAEKGQLSQKEVDALKSQIEDLSKYRAMIDIEADPEFVSKFDQPIEKKVNAIKDMLRSPPLNVSQELIDKMNLTDTNLMDQVVSQVGETKDKFLARKLERMVEELIGLNDKRQETLQEQKEKYKETLEAKKKQLFEREAEGEGRGLKHLEVVRGIKDKAGNSAFPFLSPIQPKEGVTDAEMAQIDAHNKMVELMSAKVTQAFNMKEPEERMEVAVAAAASHYLSAQLKSANAKIQSLQEELKKISAVSTETEKSKPAPIRKNGNLMSVDEALDSHFANR